MTEPEQDPAVASWENAIVDTLADGVPEVHPDNRRPTAQEFIATIGQFADLMGDVMTPAKVAALAYVSTMLSSKATQQGPVVIRTILALVQATEKVHAQAKRNMAKLEDGEKVEEVNPS